MENHKILNSDNDKFILLNFDNIFKSSDDYDSIQNTILKEKEKVINPIIDVEILRYGVKTSFSVKPEFINKAGIYSNSLIPTVFTTEEVKYNRTVFSNSLILFELWDSNDNNLNSLLSKKTIKIDEKGVVKPDGFISLDFISKSFAEYNYLYLPQYFLNNDPIDVYLKFYFFNAKNGIKSEFVFDSNNTEASFYQKLELDNNNFTWNTNVFTPKQYKNTYIENIAKAENQYNQVVEPVPTQNHLFLSTGKLSAEFSGGTQTNV